MQKVFLELCQMINGKEFRFQCDPNSPLADAKEFLFLSLKWIGQIEDANKASQKPAEEPKIENNEQPIKEG